MKRKMTVSWLTIAIAMAMTVNVSAQSGSVLLGDPIAVSTASEEQKIEETVSESGLTTEATYSDSGAKIISKMSKTAIANTYNTIYNTTYPVYEVKPVATVPYAAGKVNEQHIRYALASVNYMRQLAGLPKVDIKEEYNHYAQHGSVVLAGSGVFSHTPPCPSGMNSAFYQTGLKGTSQGNICYASGPSFTMADFTISYMKDNGGSNVTSVGHRRWILNPTMGATGFGFAADPDNRVYSVMYAFDHSAKEPDYDFIGWPSSGNFPNNLMSAAEPWSVSLNPQKFKTEAGVLNTSNVTVTVTAPNGISKTLTIADTGADVDNKGQAYYTIDTRGYGVNNCIIFRPGTDSFGSGLLSGVYTVTISGLKDSLGAPATLCYSVEFFRPEDYITGVVDLNQVNQPMDETAVEGFVKRLYLKCLSREADVAGLVYWKDRLISGDVTGSQAAQGFFFSPEYTNKKVSDSEYVETLYNVMMGRGSDEAGKADWIYKLQNGVSREGVFKGFCDSLEFQNICKSYGITKGTIVVAQARDVNPNLTTFVSRLYTKALGRAYEENGLNTWCQRINSKAWKLDDVATTGFFHSPEFINKKLDNSAYVKVLYRTFFDREYDQGGYQYWMNRLAEGASRDQVLKGFANSPEFANLKKTYGL